MFDIVCGEYNKMDMLCMSEMQRVCRSHRAEDTRAIGVVPDTTNPPCSACKTELRETRSRSPSGGFVIELTVALCLLITFIN